MQLAKKYKNTLIIADLKINFGNLKKGDSHNHMSDLCDTFSLFSLVKALLVSNHKMAHL